jgi:YesN/AraC family two-component response regulator
MTDVLVKPVSAKTLFDSLSVLRPAQRRGSILIADDDPEARELYQRLVMEAMPGVPVVCAENGAQALAIMQKDPPCLVILDLVMPEVDGFAVLQKMRALPETRHVPVLVMSGKLLSMDDIQRLNYSHVTFQSKEILSDEEVVDILQKIIGPGEILPQPTSILVKKAIAFLHQNYALPLTRQEIARSIGVSSNYLNHIFRQEIGLSPLDCLNRFRILKAREALQRSSDSIITIAAQVGFDDPSYFSRVFRKYVGQTPQSYRLMGK